MWVFGIYSWRSRAELDVDQSKTIGWSLVGWLQKHCLPTSSGVKNTGCWQHNRPRELTSPLELQFLWLVHEERASWQTCADFEGESHEWADDCSQFMCGHHANRLRPRKDLPILPLHKFTELSTHRIRSGVYHGIIEKAIRLIDNH